MADQAIPIHYVSTLDEGRELAARHDRFWVMDCGCRLERGSCSRSRIDVCLFFQDANPGWGSGKREVTPKEVAELFAEARTKHLVSRPFRNDARTDTEGICFCCDDCCGYFLHPHEVCDRGKLMEQTDRGACTDCGLCPDLCHFGARKTVEGKLLVLHENCYGCGLCLDVCPEACIEMVRRPL
jgi:Pyruvate/2-oxoacid:ferredoxin oxidoreductase delta subunit